MHKSMPNYECQILESFQDILLDNAGGLLNLAFVIWHLALKNDIRRPFLTFSFFKSIIKQDVVFGYGNDCFRRSYSVGRFCVLVGLEKT